MCSEEESGIEGNNVVKGGQNEPRKKVKSGKRNVWEARTEKGKRRQQGWVRAYAYYDF